METNKMRSLLLRLIIMSLASSFIASSANAYMIDDDRLTFDVGSNSGNLFTDRDVSHRHFVSTMPDWKNFYNESEKVNGWIYFRGWQEFPNLYDGLIVSFGNSEGGMDWDGTESNDYIADNILTKIAWAYLGKSTIKDFSVFWPSGKYRKRCHHHPVPIPGSALMLGPGLVGLAMIRRKLRIYKYN
jgi:hypothetical protein